MDWHNRFDRLLKAMTAGDAPSAKQNSSRNEPAAKPLAPRAETKTSRD